MMCRRLQVENEEIRDKLSQKRTEEINVLK
jgi:hypothetical protein